MNTREWLLIHCKVNFPSLLNAVLTLQKEPGSSSWLTVLPILEHGFHLHKGDFRDAMPLCYGIMPSNTSSTCQCGTSFSVDHAMVCPFGRFPTIRQNEVQDLRNCFSAH